MIHSAEPHPAQYPVSSGRCRLAVVGLLTLHLTMINCSKMTNLYASVLIVSSILILAWQNEFLMASSCGKCPNSNKATDSSIIRLSVWYNIEFDQVTSTISGFVNETVAVICGVKDCNQGFFYIAFDNETYQIENCDIANHADYGECTPEQCYQNCSLTLKEIMNGKTLYCFVSINSRLKSNPEIVKSSGIKVHVQG